MNKALRPERLELDQRNKKQSTITIQSYVIAGDVQTFMTHLKVIKALRQEQRKSEIVKNKRDRVAGNRAC